MYDVIDHYCCYYNDCCSHTNQNGTNQKC